jgi:hypothetical protein
MSPEVSPMSSLNRWAKQSEIRLFEVYLQGLSLLSHKR